MINSIYNFLFNILILVLLSSFLPMKNPETYSYADGSGNVYKISQDSIEYIPVKKENSSSGIYSGGEPARKAISEEDFEKIRNELERLLDNKSLQIKDRVMGSGMITVSKGKKEKTVIVKDSDEKRKLENFLKQFLN